LTRKTKISQLKVCLKPTITRRVTDLYPSLVTEDYVLRLDIPMDKFFGMLSITAYYERVLTAKSFFSKTGSRNPLVRVDLICV
jgi:hypothetical protein